jgi:hypothetical protein
VGIRQWGGNAAGDFIREPLYDFAASLPDGKGPSPRGLIAAAGFIGGAVADLFLATPEPSYDVFYDNGTMGTIRNGEPTTAALANSAAFYAGIGLFPKVPPRPSGSLSFATPKSTAVDTVAPARPPVTLFHQGDLSHGVSPNRPLSTSPVPDLTHYHPEGQLYKFEVPADVYDNWRLGGKIDNFNDLHLPSGIVKPEIRIYPPESGLMNDFLILPGH